MNSNEYTDEEGIEVREKLGNIKVSLAHVTVQGAPKSKTQEMMEDDVAQCENAIKTGKGEDFAKGIGTNLNAQLREIEEKALAKSARSW